uniref:Sm domain-containing protein n=1 Tax=Globisporangium ultimum (strain ATCC 200006 / CBS 805.95 / DAOM BR144) TaxID=431595 RepID=K3WSH5_GLOUD
MAANGTSSSGGSSAPRKDPILDLGKYIDQPVRVKFHGGREVHGFLKGYDQLVNLVLDDCVEFLRDPNDEYRLTEETRNVGLVVCRGTSVMLISPVDGTEEIPNPFLQQEE